MRPEPRQEYEALYDAPKTAFSASHAAEIEADSWNTTERLISAFEEPPPSMMQTGDMSGLELPALVSQEEKMVETQPDAPQDNTSTDETHLLKNELGDLCDFLNYALRFDAAAQRSFARGRGEMIDSIADRINEIAADILGDVLLEENDEGGYTVIEDYRSLFENWE